MLKKIIIEYLLKKNISPSREFLDFLDTNTTELSSFNQITDSGQFTEIEDLAYQLDSIYSDNDRKKNGIYFTPKKIANLMGCYSLHIKNTIDIPNIFDPAIGSGIFLLTIAKELVKSSNVDIIKIIENHLFGVDIVKENVILSKILLGTLSYELKRSLPKKFNLVQLDSLSLTEKSVKSLFSIEHFDIVISNPPYVSGEQISDDTKIYFKHYPNTVYGNPDLYIPFFELGLKLLKPSGIGAFITPNSYFRSQNGKKLRAYLRDKTEVIKLINFNSDLVFDDISHYSAINFFIKKSNDQQQNRMYFLDNYHNNITVKDFNWMQMNPIDSWHTLNLIEKSIITKLENLSETTLNNLKFQNGVATQRNNIFMFKVLHEDEDFYYFENDSKKFQVEKYITRPFVLPNKSNRDDSLRIIFPYQYENNSDIVPITPEEMLNNYPFCLEYLKTFKDELNVRKSDKNMKYWYLYGRSQGLKQYGPRLYIPYMANRVTTSLSTSNDEVFAAGYAIFSSNLLLLSTISKILESKLFSFYISKVSKPYSSGYFSTAKNMIKNLSIPDIKEISNLDVKKLTDDKLYELYNLTQEEVSYIERSF
ncbi:HsdM family class I SAM-dependent methyltransferase [Streptococcus dysgalactiae subsp. equisimilis]|uniref:Eco57I restriction-modification methylase domain-containing protein n=1 Tax=Streptococcus dysgalactiae TaxID=1334 RepID=UPI000DFB3952|nr:N-6 DNA methylase [Streptococcus dysgalactiae]MCY7234946.1 N-6 DNA methylase [Streptococcus dysgalactiae]SUN65732.1 type II restriction enzyme-methylase [Streptococcus dysgalactiae subsp. equisimilis]